ncbi:MAG: CotH kinase family protein [Ruminococcus sp.]
MKKLISIILCLFMLMSMGAVSLEVFAQVADDAPDYIKADMLYAHAVDDESETESWINWQHADSYRDYDEDDLRELGLKAGEGVSEEKYFFLPSSVNDNTVIVLNTYSSDAVIDGVTVPAGGNAEISFSTNKTYDVKIGTETQKLKFMYSTAEASIFVNNTDADGNGTDLLSYLSMDKENGAKATGAIVDDEGNVDNTPIKKIKGRGNTTWDKNKKPFNITYDSAVEIDGMQKTKKLSLLANYQDSALIRNRFLQDLSDAVGMPYASDSRFVDLYMNGEYLGSYQITQKIDIGKNNLIPEIDDNTHLNEDGTLKENFPFVVEVDAGAGDTDYWTQSSVAKCKLTVKGPELEKGDPNYDNVLNFVKTKFDAMHTAIRTDADNLSEIVDIDSLTKLYLINELSKNWDVGVSSLYFTYKQDADGNWKFFGSPVWDYDNSLGNATGVKRDLSSMKVTDYEEPTGWWVMYKPGVGGGKAGKYTILGYAAMNTTIMDYAAQVWFDEFLPAINTFNSEGVSEGELFSKDVYYSYLEGSAAMNYELGWLLTTGDWICDHSNLVNGTFDYETGEFTLDSKATYYNIDSFKGQYDYTVDWLNTRTAWLSSKFFSAYDGEITPPAKDLYLGDADLSSNVSVKDATLIQKAVANICTLNSNAARCADVNADGAVNINDATAIQKYCASIEVPYPISEKLA